MNEILHQEIAKLREQLADAEAQVQHLKNYFVETERYPAKFKLSHKETLVLNRLRKTLGFCTHRQLNVAIGKEPSHTSKLVEVYIYWLRTKLSPFGVRIGNSYGEGYFMDETSRKNLNKAVLGNVELKSRRSFERQWKEAREALPA